MMKNLNSLALLVLAYQYLTLGESSTKCEEYIFWNRLPTLNSGKGPWEKGIPKYHCAPPGKPPSEEAWRAMFVDRMHDPLFIIDGYLWLPQPCSLLGSCLMSV